MESLLLFRRALSSPTMCRFIPALSVTGFVRVLSPGFYGKGIYVFSVALKRYRACLHYLDKVVLWLTSGSEDDTLVL